MLVPYWFTVISANAFTRHCHVTGGELHPRRAFGKLMQTRFTFACSVSLAGAVVIPTGPFFLIL